MSPGRWKYRTQLVIVGEDSQKVRGLSKRERQEFAAASKKIKDGQMDKLELPGMIAKMGCIDPPLSDDDLDSMPAGLLDECVTTILKLTGVKDAPATDDDDEKKDSLRPTS